MFITLSNALPKPKKQVKGGSTKDVYYNLAHPLGVFCTLIYSAPHLTEVLVVVFSERGGVVNVGLEGIMVIGAFSGVVFNLEFAEQFGAT